MYNISVRITIMYTCHEIAFEQKTIIRATQIKRRKSVGTALGNKRYVISKIHATYADKINEDTLNYVHCNNKS